MEIVVERHQAMCIHATQHTVEYAGTNKRLVVVATVPSYAEEISLCNRSASQSLSVHESSEALQYCGSV